MKKLHDFRERVLDVVRHIPKGKVMTYGEVARRAGSPRAFRAVGTIMSHNYDTTVPCHRVVHADGTPGNYNRGGNRRKTALLQAEGVSLHYMQKGRGTTLARGKK
jgi:methylated-DNA-[protein]-cysteine S-methyltransferase